LDIDIISMAGVFLSSLFEGEKERLGMKEEFEDKISRAAETLQLFNLITSSNMLPPSPLEWSYHIFLGTLILKEGVFSVGLKGEFIKNSTFKGVTFKKEQIDIFLASDMVI